MVNLSTVFEEADGALNLASGASAMYRSIYEQANGTVRRMRVWGEELP